MGVCHACHLSCRSSFLFSVSVISRRCKWWRSKFWSQRSSTSSDRWWIHVSDEIWTHISGMPVPGLGWISDHLLPRLSCWATMSPCSSGVPARSESIALKHVYGAVPAADHGWWLRPNALGRRFEHSLRGTSTPWRCPVLALSGHASHADQCLLLGVKRMWQLTREVSANGVMGTLLCDVTFMH